MANNRSKSQLLTDKDVDKWDEYNQLDEKKQTYHSDKRIQRIMEVIKMVCNKDCEKCKQLNIKVDDKGYPWGYECLKYGDSVFREHFQDTKEFKNYKAK
jgi:hypothetical protein